MQQLCRKSRFYLEKGLDGDVNILEQIEGDRAGACQTQSHAILNVLPFVCFQN